MKIDTVHDLYIYGIKDMRTGCSATFDGMKHMREAVTDPELGKLMDHANEAINASMDAFDGILKRHGETSDDTANKALKALADEGQEWASGDYASDALRDLAILEKARNVAAYPDAGFKAFRAQARSLGYSQDVHDFEAMNPSGGSEDQTAMMDRIEASLLSKAN